MLVDIRIGITNSPREISLESAEKPADVEKVVASALDGGKSYFTLTDVKGKVFLIPTAGVAYIEVGSEERGRVGFVS
ncbi:MAG: ATP-binding protein [Frondihabitans sp.]|nr:ATP-binding protein [Frondihabitans sp.]